MNEARRPVETDPDATTVQALARWQGQDWVDEALARRIAAGAGAALAAVREALAESGFDTSGSDPEAFVSVLDSLADPP